MNISNKTICGFTNRYIMSTMDGYTTSKSAVYRISSDVWFTLRRIQTHVEMNGISSCKM